MLIEELEKLVQLKLKPLFKSVKAYRGELDRDSILQTAAGNMPAALIFIASITDSYTIDQCDTESLEFNIIMLASSQKNNIFELRRQVKQRLVGYDAEGQLLQPFRSDSFNALAITPTVSIYAMTFKCEMEV